MGTVGRVAARNTLTGWSGNQARYRRALGIVAVALAVAGILWAATVGPLRHRTHPAAPCGDPVHPRQVAADPIEPTRATTAPTIGSLAGIAAGGYMLPCESPATLSRDLDAIAASGARWVRFDFDWSSVEKNRGAFDWDALDRVVLGARHRDLEILATVAYTPDWARPSGTSDKTPPTDRAAFARFAAAAAARYAPRGVHAWEIWNEPNIAMFWKPHPDAAAYAALLEGASAAIRQQDSQATIVTAGLAPAADSADGHFVSPRTFLTRVYDTGARPSFDAVGIHPYDYPYGALAAGAWNQFWSLPATYQVMVNHGDSGKKLWGTEYGAPTGSASQAVSLDRQAAFVHEGYELWTAKPYAGPLFWYAHRDNGVNAHDAEANFGLMANDFTPKPALAAFRAVMTEPLPHPENAAHR